MLLKVHPDSPGERHLKIIAECLHSGGIIIYPTDTIYGMGCDITQSKAVEKIAQIKGIRKEKANFSFICNSLSQLSDYAKPISTPFYKMMKRTLPGPYTFVLNANSNVPKFFESKKKTVGIRVPAHEVPLRIVERLGNPIMSTSIHDEDEIMEYTTDPELIYEKYRNKVDIVIDSGAGGIIPSTIVDCTGDEPLIIREGKGDVALIY